LNGDGFHGETGEATGSRLDGGGARSTAERGVAMQRRWQALSMEEGLAAAT